MSDLPSFVGWAGPSSIFDFELDLDDTVFEGSDTWVEDGTVMFVGDDLGDFYN